MTRPARLCGASLWEFNRCGGDRGSPVIPRLKTELSWGVDGIAEQKDAKMGATLPRFCANKARGQSR